MNTRRNYYAIRHIGGQQTCGKHVDSNAYLHPWCTYIGDSDAIRSLPKRKLGQLGAMLIEVFVIGISGKAYTYYTYGLRLSKGLFGALGLKLRTMMLP
ncbi:unnamed protein product, partial [Iphiclides podalirius]